MFWFYILSFTLDISEIRTIYDYFIGFRMYYKLELNPTRTYKILEWDLAGFTRNGNTRSESECPGLVGTISVFRIKASLELSYDYAIFGYRFSDLVCVFSELWWLLHNAIVEYEWDIPIVVANHIGGLFWNLITKVRTYHLEI